MTSSSFPISRSTVLVTDASVVINLNATTRSREILMAVPGKFAVTENALAELARGASNGHDDAAQLHALIDTGLIQLVCLGAGASPVYESLVEGSALCTLDDGEAATIAHAQEIGGVAMIDERKARRLCAQSFPALQVASTVDLLLHDAVAQALGLNDCIDTVFKALTMARMRVPREQTAKVIALIGEERAAACRSLSKRTL